MANNKHGLLKKIISSFLSASCVLSMAAVGTALSSTTASAAVTPSSGDASTFSWDNATVYFLLTDRFKNGDTSNDNAYGRQSINVGDTRATFHGGDFAGITQTINDGYFNDLGVNAIWLTAPYEQIHGYIVGGDNFFHYSYHGYYVLDYTEPDAAYGTKEEFRTMVDTAHEHGIRIVMDVVMNHAGYNSMYDMNEYNYGTLKSGWDNYYKNPPQGNTSGYHDNIDYESSASDWGRWWGDWVRAGLPGYKYAPGGDEKTMSLTGLPDFRTESSDQVSIPEFLKTKWTQEGTLSAKLSKYGSSNTVTGYISDWLSDWVREYGIDGFRCDTAKHVDLASWKTLKDKCVTALKEWKAANPTKKLDDLDFWMTGEHWDHGVYKDAYYTQGGFDSMINFDCTGGGVLAAGSVAQKYNDYANAINNDDSFNVLSYISSHDSTLARPSDMYYMGSAFLLLPGAVQIYYGDESNRPVVSGVPSDGYGGAGHSLRSDMNWGENADLVKHWGIVGRFRNSHVAVGAGANISLTASSGIAFARTFDKNGITDKVAAVINASGSVSIDVSAIWADGTTLENFYDETTAVVSGGKVTFSAGAHGTILIQEPAGERGIVTVQHINQDTGDILKTQTLSGLVGESYSVSADAELTKTYDLVKTEGKTSGTYAKDGATVKFYYHLDTSKFGTVTVTHVDAATGAAIADSETLTGKVGESYSAQPVSVKNYEVDLAASTNTSGTFKSGTSTAVFKYNYVEPTGLTVHYYNANNWSKVNIYAYDKAETKQYAGAWPGSAMTNDGDGWWSYNFEDLEGAIVMFNDGGTNQEPSYMQPGYTASGDAWIKSGKVTASGKVKVIYTGTDGKVLGSETLSGMSGDSYTTSAKTFDGYTLESAPANASGTFTESTITVTYTYKPNQTALVNNSTLSATTITLGDSITANGAATGGTGTYQYQVVYKKTSATAWTTAKAYSTTATAKITPAAATTYDVCVKVKDSAGTEEKKFFTVTVKATTSTLTNSSKVSATTITLGSTITATAAASGGTSPYTYQIVYKKSTQTNWTTASAYSTNKTATIKPASSGAYQVCIKVKDKNGTEIKKFFDITVKANALTNNSTLSATAISLGSTVTAKGAAAGGTGSYTYAYYYKQKAQTTWTEAKGFSTTTSVAIKPAKATTYDVCVKVKDSAGTVEKKYFTVTVSQTLTNKSTLSATTVQLGGTITANCAATGGTGYYNYAVLYKRTSQTAWTTVQGYKANDVVTIKPQAATTYEVCVKVKDTNGTESKKFFDVNVTAEELENTSTLSATSITLGNTLTIKGSAKGGTGSYTYAIYYKKTSDSAWTEKQNFSSTATVSIKPANATTYRVCVKVKDSAGTIEKKYFDVTVKANVLTNTSTVSAESIVKGKSVTVKASATGGAGSYKYAVYYKKSSSSTWTTKQDFGTVTSVTVTPAEATAYDICVKVKDGNSTVAKKYFTVAVNAATPTLKNSSTISSTSVSKGTTVTIKGASSGVTDQVLYQYAYKAEDAANYTVIKNYSSATSATFTPSVAGNYTVRVIAQDMKPSTAVKTFYVTVK